MSAPWYSGMAQGISLSFYVRFYKITGESRYLEVSEKIFQSFLNYVRDDKTSDNPWVSYVDEVGFLWIEEYPIFPPAHTLNGFNFGIWGIYEYWLATGKRLAERTLEAAITTVEYYLPRFRNENDVSFYCLQHEVQSLKYHNLHIRQLKKLSQITKEDYFVKMTDKLSLDTQTEKTKKHKHSEEILTDGLIVYWPMNSLYGENEIQNTGTVMGTKKGELTNLFYFDGEKDYLEVSDNDSLDLTKTCTITAWVKLFNQNHWHAILARRSSLRRSRLLVSPSLRLFYETSQDNHVTSNTGLQLGEWNYISTVIRDLPGSDVEVIFYINESREKKIIAKDSLDWGTTSDLWVGANVPSANYMLEGFLGELRVYNRALSMQEIKNIYDQTKLFYE